MTWSSSGKYKAGYLQGGVGWGAASFRGTGREGGRGVIKSSGGLSLPGLGWQSGFIRDV